MNRVALLIAYFGEFPEWSDLYFETLRRNPEIDFIFYTDVDGSKYEAKNIRFHRISYEDYIQRISHTLKVNFQPASPYKLCDIRPFHGIVHEADFQGYDFFGWTDMDILFGNIRKFYTDAILNRYDVFSTHEVRISGHLAIFRNDDRNRKKCFDIYDWKKFVEKPEFVGIDEHGITNAYRMTMVDRINEKFGLNIDNALSRFLKKRRLKRMYMVEQYTTPFTVIPWIDGTLNSDQPEVWFYKDGSITNDRDGKREFMYLHLMNFRSSQWRHDGTRAPWENKDRICFAVPEDLKTGIRIDRSGIHPIKS